jgi:hypothetical protein
MKGVENTWQYDLEWSAVFWIHIHIWIQLRYMRVRNPDPAFKKNADPNQGLCEKNVRKTILKKFNSSYNLTRFPSAMVTCF